MYFITLLLYIACPVTLVAGIIMLFFKSKRKVGIIIVASSCIIWAASAFYLKDSSRGTIIPAGFVTFEDFRAAKKENVTDPMNSEYLGSIQFFGDKAYIDIRAYEILKRSREEKDKRLEALAPSKQQKACLENLQCAGDRFLSNAAKACSDRIEQLAPYNVEWTDDTFTPKFTRFNWKDKNMYIISYEGDAIEFQTLDGSWLYQTYQCDYNFFDDTVIDVKAAPGRLPE